MFYLSEFHTKQDLVLNYHILQLYLQWYVIGLFNCGSFIVHILLLGTSKIFHIVSFSALRMRSRPSAGHTT